MKKYIFPFVILITILVVIGSFYFFVKLIVNAPQNAASKGKITIENGTSNSNNFKIEDDGDETGYNIKYLSDGKFQEAYHISKSITSDSLSRSLFSQAKEGKSSLTSCFTPENKEESRLVDITFDISGSINSLAEGFASFKDKIMSRINEILRSEQLRPGDHIRVRFLGANTKVVENIKFDFDFVGPDFQCSLIYQRTHNLGIVTLTGISFPVATDDSLILPSQVIEKIREIYDKTIGIKGATGHNTYLVEHLNTIGSDNQLEHYGSVIYILQTDGEFSDVNSNLTNPLNVSLDGGNDKVYFIGLNKKGHVSDLSTEDKMKELFKPINYIKFIDSVNY